MTIDMGMFPGLGELFFWAIFLFLALIFGFGAYASHRAKIGKPIKGVTIKDGSAFIGCVGSGLSLKIVQEGSLLKVRWARANYFIIIGACFLFGPGVVMMFVFFPEKVNPDIPIPVMGLMAIIICAATYACAYNLRTLLYEEPVVEITIEGIRLKRGNLEVDNIRKRDILAFEIETSVHTSSGKSRRTFENYTLIVKAENKNAVRLCITDNKAQLEQLKKDLETKLQVIPV